MQSSSYLILHSEHDSALDKPWLVIRCYFANAEQELLFTGSRADAIAFLFANWEV